MTAADGPPPVVVRDRSASRRRTRARRGAAALTVSGVLVAAAALLVPGAPAPATGPPPSRRPAVDVLSARRLPEVLVRPVALRSLRAAAAPVVADAPPSSCLVVRDGGADVLSVHPTADLAPASNMKLLTAAAALDVLGPATTLTTRVVGRRPSGGTVTGDLFLVGGGDPLLTTQTGTTLFTHGPQQVTSMERLADRVVASGVRRVSGSVVGDGGRHEPVRSLPTWPRRFVGNGIVAPLSALLVNDGWRVSAVPPATGGGPAEDPDAHAAAVLTELLTARGVIVDGPPRSGRAPTAAPVLVAQPSLPVRTLVAEMLTFSDNTTAELLLRELDLARGGRGTTAGGAAVLARWTAAHHPSARPAVVVDGSGLSPQNRVTCTLLVDVLQAGGRDGLLAGGLARPGRPGTLDDRLRRPEVRDRVRAKTGTLNDVTALSGWVRTTRDVDLAFAVVENTGGRRVTADDIALQSRLVDAVVAYPQGPPVDALAPGPAVDR